MNFKELQDEVSDLLNFNSSQTDQDFTTSQIKKSINRAYLRETNKARQEGLSSYFKAVTTFTWPSGSKTFALPGNIQKRFIINMDDITDQDPGRMLTFSDNPLVGDLFWLDRNTIQWGEDGPGADKSIRVEFFVYPETLLNDDDEPSIIGPEHHELLYYSAAIDLRTRADEAAPMEWLRQQMELRIDLYKDLSRGRPIKNVPTISSHVPDAADFAY